MKNEIDFTVSIKGLPKDKFLQLMASLQKSFLQQFGIIFEPTNDVKIIYDSSSCEVWESCLNIVAHALTIKVLEDEIKNGN